MYTMVLVKNNDDELAYDVYNGTTNDKLNTITMNKHDRSYKLAHGDKFTNQYETSVYRVMLKIVDDPRTPPKEYSNGWY